MCQLVVRVRIHQRSRRVAPEVVRDEMLKRRRVIHSRRKTIQAPKILQELKDRSMRVFSPIIASLLLDDALANPRRDQEGRDANPETLEVEGDILPVWCGLCIQDIVASGDIDGWGHVVAETAVLVEGQDEEGFFPLGGVADGFIDAFDEVLAQGDGRRWVEGLVGAAFRVDVCELW